MSMKLLSFKKKEETHMKAIVLAKPNNLGGTLMKAIVCTKYGPPDVLKLEEIQKPTPGDDEILVEVHAASVTYSNLILVRGKPFLARLGFGLLKPKLKIPGSDIAGRVEAVGRNAKQFRPGDEVFGDLSNCGRGCYAEYVCVPENVLALKPANMSFEEAAAVPVAAVTALQGLRDKGQIQPGQKVLIYGASGGIGTFAVQIAKYFGAEVTGVCSTRNLDMVRSIGADEVIDYTQNDFTTSNQRYDLILECVGNHSFSECRRVLNPTGRFVMVGGPHEMSVIGLLAFMIKPLLLSLFVSQKAVMFIAKSSQDDLTLLGELIATGKLKPVMGGSYSLSNARDAVRQVEEGHARGKVIITLDGADETWKNEEPAKRVLA